jgi:hypothetical protein
MKHRLEIVTNIIVIAVALLIGVRFVETMFFQHEVAPLAGQTVPDISGYSWSKGPTLVLALKKGCHFCEESMPFYRHLQELQQAGKLNVQIMAVFPDGSADVTDIMKSQQLSIRAFSAVRLDAFRVSGTPTLILVDQRGKVVKPWIGKQSADGENDVIRTLGQVSSTFAIQCCSKPDGVAALQ